ncbi:leucyl-tRNA synthetase [Ureibacillus massiliensis 4400831 = CIP 108448 = CCUG 49529]|uniref:Leucyl-tRNA synthetase n=1 Tax=Ureibacillus massiliensis 4400831 = CIP 108448 = CCUG 49529 TaxID=1211035 RepID=A0A0A3IZX6_9BACL|nr:hypothetical protein [Ureibacillus massiliensis]KGR90251.1 leucyl-tRNA synthetase [Ureibacillus massiliensis 4400831 = CIP 108448 = CCUG 49529]
MKEFNIVNELKPINVSHDTYRRECSYTRGIHIPETDFMEILDMMSQDVRLYFEFHNPGKPIQQGTYLNGHAGLAKTIAHYYQNKNSVRADGINNGKDFYVKII